MVLGVGGASFYRLGERGSEAILVFENSKPNSSFCEWHGAGEVFAYISSFGLSLAERRAGQTCFSVEVIEGKGDNKFNKCELANGEPRFSLYQPQVPGEPLNGPANSWVIQPP